jgi:hypothetical protein
MPCNSRVLGYLDLYGMFFHRVTIDEINHHYQSNDPNSNLLVFRKAYRSLNRKYRKNLKKLVCTPSLPQTDC